MGLGYKYTTLLLSEYGFLEMNEVNPNLFFGGENTLTANAPGGDRRKTNKTNKTHGVFLERRCNGQQNPRVVDSRSPKWKTSEFGFLELDGVNPKSCFPSPQKHLSRTPP